MSTPSSSSVPVIQLLKAVAPTLFALDPESVQHAIEVAEFLVSVEQRYAEDPARFLSVTHRVRALLPSTPGTQTSPTYSALQHWCDMFTVLDAEVSIWLFFFEFCCCCFFANFLFFSHSKRRPIVGISSSLWSYGKVRRFFITCHMRTVSVHATRQSNGTRAQSTTGFRRKRPHHSSRSRQRSVPASSGPRRAFVTWPTSHHHPGTRSLTGYPCPCWRLHGTACYGDKKNRTKKNKTSKDDRRRYVVPYERRSTWGSMPTGCVSSRKSALRRSRPPCRCALLLRLSMARSNS